jgi:hypothetical protein
VKCDASFRYRAEVDRWVLHVVCDLCVDHACGIRDPCLAPIAFQSTSACRADQLYEQIDFRHMNIKSFNYTLVKHFNVFGESASYSVPAGL